MRAGASVARRLDPLRRLPGLLRCRGPSVWTRARATLSQEKVTGEALKAAGTVKFSTYVTVESGETGVSCMVKCFGWPALCRRESTREGRTRSKNPVEATHHVLCVAASSSSDMYHDQYPDRNPRPDPSLSVDENSTVRISL